MKIVNRYLLIMIFLYGWMGLGCCGEDELKFIERVKIFSEIFAGSAIKADGKIDRDKVLRQGEALYQFVPEVVREINRRNSRLGSGAGRAIAELESFSVYYLYDPDSPEKITGVEDEEADGYKSTADGFAEINKNVALYLCYRPGWEELCSFSHPRFRTFIPTANGKWYVQCIVGRFPSDDQDDGDSGVEMPEDRKLDLTPLAVLPVDTLALQMMPGRPCLTGINARTVMLHAFSPKIKDLSFLSDMSFSGLHIYACDDFDPSALKDCAAIDSFVAEECGTISDLSGFSRCRQITHIELNSVSADASLVPLQLPKLQSLSLLSKSTKNAEHCDISPLRDVKTMRELSVDVSDCSQLSGLENLRKLTVHGGDADGRLDLRGLESTVKLNDLEIVSGSVDGLAVIANLPVQSLTLPGGDDFAPLAKLKYLKKLVINPGRKKTVLATLSALSGLNLQELVVNDGLNPGDYSFLRNFKSITSLTAVSIKNLRCLEHLPLKNLDISFATADDYSPLAALKELVTLKLEGSKISDLSPLHGLKKLQYLNLYGTEVKDVTPVVDLPLRYLNVVDDGGDETLQKSPAVRKILSRFPCGVR